MMDQEIPCQMDCCRPPTPCNEPCCQPQLLCNEPCCRTPEPCNLGCCQSPPTPCSLSCCRSASRPATPGSEDANSSSSSVNGVSSAASSTVDPKLRPIGAAKEYRGRVQPRKFKTQLCSYYIRGEPCPYTPWCAFAHGDDERRSVEGNVSEGVASVNTLPRTLVYHEIWVQTTKYTRKTGPANPATSAAKPQAPPVPSFMRKKTSPVSSVPSTPKQHNPYGTPAFLGQPMTV